MKVLQINSVCGIGSTGRIATDIHNMLIEQGHESYIAYGRDLPRNCDNAIRIGNKIDNYAHVLLTRLFDKHGFGSIKATEEFIKKVEEIDPDVIHLHNIHGYYINIEVLFDYLKEADKPVIWTLHDCWAFTGHCAYFDYVGCEKWKTGCYDCPEKKSYPSSRLLDKSKQNYLKKKEIFTGVKNMTIVTPSSWLAELVRESFLGECPVKVINNGIDLKIFKPTKSNFREKYNIEDKFIILGVANVWDRRKGFDYFIELSKLIKIDEIIVMVGLTEKQKRSLPDNIIGITRTNDVNELVEIYTAADYFLNPSLEETMGLVTVEALACGTPVIVSNSTAVPEVVNEKCGKIVLDNSTKGFYSAIVNNDRDFSSIECIKQAQKYDKQKMYKKYLNLYNEVNR
ncbi:MAG: glycosyltransferase [Caldicoprobacterales bacterium]